MKFYNDYTWRFFIDQEIESDLATNRGAFDIDHVSGLDMLSHIAVGVAENVLGHLSFPLECFVSSPEGVFTKHIIKKKCEFDENTYFKIPWGERWEVTTYHQVEKEVEEKFGIKTLHSWTYRAPDNSVWPVYRDLEGLVSAYRFSELSEDITLVSDHNKKSEGFESWPCKITLISPEMKEFEAYVNEEGELS